LGHHRRLNANARDYFGAKDGGVSVEDISPDGPAAKSDLKVQDVIVAIDGQKVQETWDLQKAVMDAKPGTVVTLDVLRDKKPLQVKIKLAEMPGKYTGTEEPKALVEAPEKSPLGITSKP